MNLSKEQKTSLDFYDSDFLIKIQPLICSLEAEVIGDKLFQLNVSKLIFKWIIHMKQTFKTEFSIQIEENINSSYESLRRLFDKLPLLNDFSRLDGDTNSIPEPDNLDVFLDIEFLERGNSIFNPYHGVIKEFYYGTSNCTKIKEKYFGGDFNNDLALKALIERYDIFDFLKQCFSKSNVPLPPWIDDKPPPGSGSIILSLIHRVTRNPFAFSKAIIDFLQETLFWDKFINSPNFLCLTDERYEMELLKTSEALKEQSDREKEIISRIAFEEIDRKYAEMYTFSISSGW